MMKITFTDSYTYFSQKLDGVIFQKNYYGLQEHFFAYFTPSNYKETGDCFDGAVAKFIVKPKSK